MKINRSTCWADFPGTANWSHTEQSRPARFPRDTQGIRRCLRSFTIPSYGTNSWRSRSATSKWLSAPTAVARGVARSTSSCLFAQRCKGVSECHIEIIATRLSGQLAVGRALYSRSAQDGCTPCHHDALAASACGRDRRRFQGLPRRSELTLVRYRTLPFFNKQPARRDRGSGRWTPRGDRFPLSPGW